jgi:arginase
MDFVDPAEAPGVGTPCPGGATYREAHLATHQPAPPPAPQLMSFLRK